MKESKILVAPSILSADFANMAGAISRIEGSGADWIHCDIMDGQFVPAITFGPKMIEDIRKRTSMVLDVHLMVENPEACVPDFITAGASNITFHVEACVHAHRLLTFIREKGCRAGISLVPSTPISALSEIIHMVDQVLVMSVNPGFGGQTFIPRSLDRIAELARLREQNSLQYLISVDGGVNPRTVAAVRDAGADVLISGSAFFAAPDAKAEVEILRTGGNK